MGGLPLAVRLAGHYLAEVEEDAEDYLTWLKETPLQALDHGQRQPKSVPLLLERSLGQVSEEARHALAPFDRELVAEVLEAPAAKIGLPIYFPFRP